MRAKTANGWQFFTATLLIVTGAINIIQGLVSFFTPEFYLVPGSEALFLGTGGWGFLLGVWGVLLVIAGLGALSRGVWARTLGIFLAAVNVIAQLAFFGMPMWTMTAIAIDLLVIYGLTAGWPDRADEGTSAEEEEAVYRSGRQDAQEAPQAPRPRRHGTAEDGATAPGRRHTTG